MNVLPREQLLELTVGSTWIVKHKRAGVSTKFTITHLDEQCIVNTLGTRVGYIDIVLDECVELMPRSEDATYPKLLVFPSQYAKPF